MKTAPRRWKKPALATIVSGFVLLAIASDSAIAARRLQSTRMYDPLLDEAYEPAANPADDSLMARIFGFLLLQPELPAVTEAYFAQKLDPSNPSDPRTFQQRYYVYSKHAAGPGAPVVLYIGGEAELRAQSFVGRFAEKVAETLHAHLVGVEHRYYGKSQPFEQLTPENLRYLSTDNALADLVAVQSHLTKELGLSGQWVAMGGSYPGSLSAYYRLKHPELVVGSLASSAPVQAKNDFEEYDAHVTKVIPPACAESLRKVVDAAHAALDAGPEKALEFKKLFDAAEVTEDGDFLYVLADVTAAAVQYGYPGELCDPLTKSADPVTAYAGYVREYLKKNGQTAAEFSPAVALKLGAQESGGMRQWLYQSCREYGYWQDAHRDPLKSVRSPRLGSSYDRGLCQRFFGLDGFADESVINRKYYEPLLDPAQASRILFTNGSDDPWSELSITHERGNATNPATVSFMIQGKAHCSDLRGLKPEDPAPLQQARDLFLGLAADWIAR